jgi:hypothetical protein
MHNEDGCDIYFKIKNEKFIYLKDELKKCFFEKIYLAFMAHHGNLMNRESRDPATTQLFFRIKSLNSKKRVRGRLVIFLEITDRAFISKNISQKG